MKRSIHKIIIFVLIVITGFLVLLNTNNKPIQKSKLKIADTRKIEQNKTFKKTVIKALFGEELISIMQLDSKNNIDTYLKNRERIARNKKNDNKRITK